MVVTDDAQFAERMQRFRNHGITRDHHQRRSQGTWSYEMVDLGYNYRITDIQCALGKSQLDKLAGWIKRRRQIARHYDEAFAKIPAIEPLRVKPDVYHAYHLYVCQIHPTPLNTDRDAILKKLYAEGIGVNIHYIPVHLHPFYQNNFTTKPGLCPAAEKAYESLISLPIFPKMTEQDINTVISSIKEVFNT
jgi:perosamine synthetase